jgi:hypothetical protein
MRELPPDRRRARLARLEPGGVSVKLLRVRAGVTVHALPEGDAVVSLDPGTTAIIVNATAHAVLDLLAEARSEEEIAQELHGSFPGQDLEAVRRDVGALVSELERAGIVEPCGDASSTA